MSNDTGQVFRRARLVYQAKVGRIVTIADVAAALGLSRQTVSDWENGQAVPKLRQLTKLADLYGVDLDTLVHGTERRRPGE